MKKILFLLGTRPEAIKLAPLISAFQLDHSFDVRVCITGQHKEMLSQVISFFNINVDFDLNLMQENQSQVNLISKGIVEVEKVLDQFTPDLVFVQGDTTTVLIGSLVSFLKKVKVAHIEAGLRSFDKQSPFPEEMNRVLTSKLADYHFAPTARAKKNLENESISDHVYEVGNTVVDALNLALARLVNHDDAYHSKFSSLDLTKRILLVTCHRRESFGKPFEQICSALIDIADRFEDVRIVYPVHLNPNIKEVASQMLKHDRIFLIPPVDYPELVWLMMKSCFILTDSGGIQEEAPTLKKPVLILRNLTERTEGVNAGTARLIGTNRTTIVEQTSLLLEDHKVYNSMIADVNPYGDGMTSEKILNIIKKELNQNHLR